MATTDLFQTVFSLMDEALDGYVISTSADVIAFITPVLTSLLIIWIAIWGYE